jgi:hypothetical protein
MRCDERWRLLMATMPPARELGRAMHEIGQTSKNSADYDLKVAEREEATNRLRNALDELHQHIAEHGCRGKNSN